MNNNLKPILSHVHIDKVNEFYHEKEIEEIDFTLKYFNHLFPYFYDTGSFCAIYREKIFMFYINADLTLASCELALNVTYCSKRQS